MPKPRAISGIIEELSFTGLGIETLGALLRGTGGAVVDDLMTGLSTFLRDDKDGGVTIEDDVVVLGGEIMGDDIII